MATRQMKMPRKDSLEHEVEEVPSQEKRPERGRFLLQVDRQTKGSYATSEAAQAAALVIKRTIRSRQNRWREGDDPIADIERSNLSRRT